MCLFSSLFSIFLTIPLASDFDKRRWIALGIHVTHCLMIKGHFIIISFFFWRNLNNQFNHHVLFVLSSVFCTMVDSPRP